MSSNVILTNTKISAHHSISNLHNIEHFFTNVDMDKSFNEATFETRYHCLSHKITKKTFLKGKIASQLLDTVHLSIREPLEVETHSGKEYFRTFIDDY